jgi:hypothetical protein
MRKRDPGSSGTVGLLEAWENAKPVIRGLLGAPTEDEGRQMGLLDEAFLAAHAAGDRRGMAEAIGQQAALYGPNMLGAGVTRNVDPALWHPVGNGLKLSRPVDEMTSVVDAMDIAPRQNASIENMQGSYLIPALGDRSAAGGVLRSVNDVALENAVNLEGGPDFMRSHLPYGEAWASDKGVTSRLGKQIRDLSADGSDVNLVYSAMGHKALGFNTMLSDALVEQLPSMKITRKAASAFDADLKALDKKWPGITSPDIKTYLRNAPGSVRVLFSEVMSKAKHQEAGFPDVASTRKAVTAPELLDVPLNQSGYSIARMDPTGATTNNPSSPHTTYNTHMAGEYVGGLETPVPREMLFRDFFQNREMNRPENFNPKNTGDNRAFMMSNVSQKVDQQLVDEIMNYQSLIGGNR